MWAIAGYAVTLIFSYTSGYFPGSLTLTKMELCLWPSSIFLMALQDNGNPGDDQIRVIATIANVILYSIVGLIVWFISSYLTKKH
jgi:hypothetical protein